MIQWLEKSDIETYVEYVMKENSLLLKHLLEL